MFKAINRLKWRLSSKNSFTPNKEDKMALNEILLWVNNQKEKTIQDNKLLTKLFIVYFKDMIVHYDTMPNDKILQSQVSKIFKTKLSVLHKDFKDFIDSKSRFDFLESTLGTETKENLTADIYKQDLDISKLTEEQTKKYLGFDIDLFYTENKIKDMVSELVNRYKNYD